MAEWSKAHDWKSCIRLSRIEGSNPSLSAKESIVSVDQFFFLTTASKPFWRLFSCVTSIMGKRTLLDLALKRMPERLSKPSDKRLFGIGFSSPMRMPVFVLREFIE